MKKKRGLKINFSKVSNRTLYSLISIFLILTVAVGVYAYGTSNPSNFGHSAGEISGLKAFATDGIDSCPAGSSIRVINNAGTVTCETDDTGASAQNLNQVLSQGNNAGNNEIVNVNGLRIGSSSSPGAWGLYVDGQAYVSDYLRADGGINVGGSSNPGTDNLIVDGTTTLNGNLYLYGIPSANPAYYLCFAPTNGRVSYNSGICGASSKRFKQNISDLDYGLADILKFRPVTFQYKPEYSPDNSLKLGLIAEEVQNVVPELVTYDEQGKPQGVDYLATTSLLIKGIQQQQDEIEALKSENNKLSERLKVLEESI